MSLEFHAGAALATCAPRCQSLPEVALTRSGSPYHKVYTPWTTYATKDLSPEIGAIAAGPKVYEPNQGTDLLSPHLTI